MRGWANEWVRPYRRESATIRPDHPENGDGWAGGGLIRGARCIRLDPEHNVVVGHRARSPPSRQEQRMAHISVNAFGTVMNFKVPDDADMSAFSLASVACLN